jgi:GNAT superfamily N-acetyltransferase
MKGRTGRSPFVNPEEAMNVRLAREADAVGIARVHVDTWRTTYKGLMPDDLLAGLSYERRENYWRSLIADASRPEFVYVAEGDDGQIVGFVSGGPELSGDPIYKGALYAIYVLAEHQGRGIGRQLTRANCQRLIEQGMTSMLVWVLDTNPWRAFYEALGGKPVREKQETMGEAILNEVGYGWEDIRGLAEPPSEQ